MVPHWFETTTSPSNLKAIALACLPSAAGVPECVAADAQARPLG